MREDIENKAEWMEFTITGIQNRHAIHISATARSKRWWTLEVEAKRKEYSRTRRLYKYGKANAFTLMAERNSYYYTIRWAKIQY